MAPANIDFQRIRSFGGSQNHAFEELCSQLAALEVYPDGAVFHRKGIGADAGVECFVRHKNGAETGWQSKYFFEFGASQLAQLDKSIEQALDKHPRLTRFVVCIPIDLRDQRVGKAKTQLQRWLDWVTKWKAKAKKSRRALSLELWSKMALVERLGRDNPLYSGRAAFWFDETLLASKWFEARFERARAGLGERYTPETNIELPIRRSILAFCRDPSLLDEVQRWGEKLEEERHDALRDLAALSDVADLSAEIATLDKATSALSSILSATPPEPDYIFPIEEMVACAREALSTTALALRASWRIKTEDTKAKERIRYLGHSLGKLETLLDGIAEALGGERWRVVNPRRVLVTGPAGVGKSHLFGDAVDHQVAQGRPAVLILGGTLVDDEPWTQIVKQLGLSIPVETFLGAMDAAAESAGTRAVIFVDAINERHGIAIWSEQLAAFLRTIEPFPRVAVALSCRSTYLPYILRDGPREDLPQLEHVGFAGRAAEAARVYLDRRGIVRMAAPNLVPEFENPLFLKTCCDYLEKEGLTELPRGLRGVTEIFGFYTQAVAKSVEHRLGLDRKLNIVMRALEVLANAFDQGERGYLEYHKAAELLEPILASGARFERSLLAQLVSEGVLADEPVTGDDGNIVQTVRFSFERYSDHRIARQLLDKNLDPASPMASFAVGLPLHDYLTKRKAYEHAGVIEAMAIQLPERCGIELPDTLPKGSHNHLVHEAFLDSILWRNQKAFTRKTVDLLGDASRITGEDEVLKALLAIATEPDNVFNAKHLDGVLAKMTMPERDKAWSTYIAYGADEDSPVETLITWTLHNGFAPIDGQRTELAALTLGWLFSTSNRYVRDRATKALAALLSTQLDLAARIVEHFKDVDDLYILDRVIAAAYGAALQGLDTKGLTALALAVFTCVFDHDEPVVHVLIRDHARGIVELAHRRNVLPATVDIGRARPPYRSGWPIEEVSEEAVEEYKQDYPGGHRFTDDIVSSAVNDGDFARYVSDKAIDDFSSLPISWIGRTENDIYAEWAASLAATNSDAFVRLNEVIAACDTWRERQPPESPMRFSIRLVAAGEQPDEDARSKFEKAVDEAEGRLEAALGPSGWKDYNSRARHFVREGIRGAKRFYQWPPLFDMWAARRWICKRAHDFGWTQERFGEFDRNLGRSGDRYNHRIERVGKKYQWLAFHELVARLGDNTGFIGWTRRDGMSQFQGPWQVNRRDMDPSLFATRTPEERRQSDRTWWMPAQIMLKPMSPHARLVWLDGPEDMVNGIDLITVVQPKTNRTWLVVDETEGWIQWGMRNGERTLDRQTWFNLTCLLVRSSDRDKFIQALSGRMFNHRHDGTDLDKPTEGYIGEYPWHPLYADMSPWIASSDWTKLKVPFQPTVTEYFAERSGHDYSIEDSIRVNVPAPGLIVGMKLHLSNGRDLSYAGDDGTVLFFDPSTHEAGPGAALVDRDAFRAFLSREGLAAVWIINGEKEVHGGRKHHEGYGGSRSFSSVYWLEGDGFKRLDYEEEHQPTRDQLAKFFDEAGVTSPPIPSGSRRKATKGGAAAKKRKRASVIGAKPKPAKRKKTALKKKTEKAKKRLGTTKNPVGRKPKPARLRSRRKR